jgi:hypothetical protein
VLVKISSQKRVTLIKKQRNNADIRWVIVFKIESVVFQSFAALGEIFKKRQYYSPAKSGRSSLICKFLSIFMDSGGTDTANIGLLKYESRGFVKKGLGKHTRLFYASKPTKIGFPSETNNQLDLGHVLLTNTGKAMVHSLSAPRNQIFYEYVISRWFNQGLVLSSIQLNFKSRKHTTKQELLGNR